MLKHICSTRKLGVAILLLAVAVVAGCASQPATQGSDKPVQREQLIRNAEFYYLNQEWESAQQHYLQLTQLEPDESLYWYRLGNVYYHGSLPKSAVEAYHKALVIKPDYSEARHNLAIAYFRLAMDEWTLVSQMEDAEQVKSSIVRLLLSIVEQLEEE